MPGEEQRPAASGGEPFVGARDWPQDEMRWPPAPAASPQAGAPESARAPLWPVLLSLLASWPLLMLVSGSVLALFLIARGKLGLLGDGEHEQELLHELITAPGGLLVAFLPTQITLVALALIGAALSGVAPSRALGLERPRVGAGRMLAYLALTAVLYCAVAWLASALYGDPSPSMKAMEELTQSVPLVRAIPLFALVPGVCEELYFRGYAQRALLLRWKPWAAIPLTALVFAGSHNDWMHFSMVLPLGLWLGWVSWRSSSVWPAMACHALNNGIACALASK